MRTLAQVHAMLDAQAKRWGSCSYSRLLVRAWLLSPVANDVIGHMPLDGLLAVGTLQLLGISIDELGDMHPEPYPIAIPARKVGMAGAWIYATSWARFHETRVDVTRCKRKHFHESRFIVPKLIDTSSGKFRSYDLKTAAVATPYVEWTVDADRGEIVKLLPHLASVGKDRNTGLGTVAFWEVGDTDRDPLVHDGIPQRNLPCLDGDLTPYAPGSCALGVRSIRPPYVWHGTRMQCAIPTGAT